MNRRMVVAGGIAAGALIIGFSISGHQGLRTVSVSGIASGNGTQTSPLDVVVHTGNGVTGTGAASSPLQLATQTNGWFGDGADGDVTISVDTDLTSDMFYQNLTVNSGVRLNNRQYHIYVSQTLQLDGTIGDIALATKNAPASTTTTNSGGTNDGAVSHTLKAANAGHTLGVTGGYQAYSGKSTAYRGGLVGNATVGLTTSSPETGQVGLPDVYDALKSVHPNTAPTNTTVFGLGGANGTFDNGVLGHCWPGGGGASGGYVAVAARKIAGNGVIEANGGDSSPTVTCAPANCGWKAATPGVAGVGGIVAVAYSSRSGTWTATANAGFEYTAPCGSETGTCNSNVGPGTSCPGPNGPASDPGLVMLFPMGAAL